MKKSIKIALKVLAIVLAFALVISSVFIIRSCSAPPEYSEIKARVEELIEASFDVNDVIWGEGLPTYERVIDPKSSLTLYESGKTYVDADGKEQPLNYYYYYVISDGNVVAFRGEKDYKADYAYAYVSDKALDKASLAALYPQREGEDAPENLYTEAFVDAEAGVYAYFVPFSEPKYDFYYVSSDPTDYDYVSVDSKYLSVDDIKACVRTVYAPDYADSLDQVLFDGVAEGEFIQKARYSVLQRSGSSMLTSLNTYEPLFTERRVYLYETAQIDRGSSNDTSVVVEFSTYLPSNPDKKVVASLSFVLVDGVWYLASPTY